MLNPIRNFIFAFAGGVFHGWPKLASFRLPRHIVVEATNRCNLRCPVCATSQHMNRPKEDFPLGLFDALLKQITWKVTMLNFGYSGEPLLNKNLTEMIRRGSSRNIPCGFDTNGVLVAEYAKELVGAKTAYINIALDGLKQETLIRYRLGSDFKSIVEGIKKIVAVKAAAHAKLPRISIQFLAMKHNEHEITEIVKLARKLTVDELKIKTFNPDLGFWLSPAEKQKVIASFMPETLQLRRLQRKHLCMYPFTSPVILNNGDVSLCCLDFNGTHTCGNITENTLEKIWKGKAYIKLRSAVAQNKLALCKECNFDYSVNTVMRFR